MIKARNKGAGQKKGHIVSPETRLKIKIANTGKKRTLEVRRKLSDITSARRKRVRRWRIKINGGFHSLGEWETVKAQFNWSCPSCSKSEPEITLTRDHIIPISKGGTDNIENIQPLCRKCNTLKSTSTITY